jgi:hypothetical protein
MGEYQRQAENALHRVIGFIVIFGRQFQPAKRRLPDPVNVSV